MSLYIKKITSEFEDMEKFRKVNDESFPEEEHMPIEEMLKMIGKNEMEVSAIYDSKEFVGFYAMVVYKTIAYIFFLAIDSNLRSKGYGSKTLSLMKNQYADYQIVLDLESVDVNAENTEQRRARKQFYLRNGFKETNYDLSFNGMQMQVLCSDNNFDANAFQILLEKMKGTRASMKLIPK